MRQTALQGLVMWAIKEFTKIKVEIKARIYLDQSILSRRASGRHKGKSAQGSRIGLVLEEVWAGRME